jgi:arylsulfatase A-like enzyme
MAHQSADDWRTIGRALLLGAPIILGACRGSDSVAATAPAEAARDRRPNIIFLLADDMRADAASYAGNRVVRTPSLDALAHAGVSFSNAYVTSPVCAISRASIFTGQYARRHGIIDFDHDFDAAALAQTYPALLRAAGYRTGFIGKFGVGNNPPAQLFDFWRGFVQASYEATENGRPVHLTRLMTDQAIEFLRTQPANKPFALSISYKAPHAQDEDPRQFIVEDQDAATYADVDIPLPATADDVYWAGLPAFFRTNNLARDRWMTLFSTRARYQESVRGYYRLINGLDRSVGAIRAALRASRLERNTVIVFSSDNGFFLGEHGLSHKWYGYEPSVRVPLIVYDPRDRTGQNGRVETSIVLNEDIAPTLLDLAGVSAPAVMQGRSLLDMVHGRARSQREDFLFEHMLDDSRIRRSVGVVGGRYKYLRYMDPQPNYEMLFDLETDPDETENLALDARYADVLAGMRQRYAELAAKAR